jgi:predicted RNase H-like HicB family nuclease
MTEGDTTAEALANLDDAMRGWVTVMVEDGEAIPPPRRRP